MQAKLRCYAVSEGRQPVLMTRPDGDTVETGETELAAVTFSFWDDSIPADVHTDRKTCITLTVMDKSLFAHFKIDGVYTFTIT